MMIDFSVLIKPTCSFYGTREGLAIFGVCLFKDLNHETHHLSLKFKTLVSHFQLHEFNEKIK